MSKKILSVVGARPQFIKAATVSRALAAEPGLREVMVHTGQHFDDAMSKVFFEELAIPDPAYNLDIHGGGHGDMTGRMLSALEKVVVAEAPAAVLVYGDTNSTLAGALASQKLHIPVFHVEAGLRSYNRRMPEEVNRVLTDHLSSLLLCPTAAATANLAREGITSGVLHVGDVMFDAVLHLRRHGLSRSSIMQRLGLDDGGYVLMTLHRAENTEDRANLQELLDYATSLAGARTIVFPVHPRTRQTMDRLGITCTGMRQISPVGYLDMHRLLAGTHMVLTDSGGVQKEAYFHRVPCVTLREETEWIETVEAGWNRLWRVPDYAPRRDITDYGKGDAAVRIVHEMKAWLAS